MSAPRFNRPHVDLAAVVAVLLSLAIACATARAADDPKALLTKAQGQFKPLPHDAGTKDFPITSERVALGRLLFFDPRISIDGTWSCSRCHLPALYATDGLPKSRGVGDKTLPRNAPTVFNSGIYASEHWRGELKNDEQQATGALIGPAFGNTDYAQVRARLKAIPGYAPLFAKAFPKSAEPINEENWGLAIGAYERTLMTPGPWDDYLGGKTEALSAGQQRGLAKFLDLGCADCHDGVGVGGGKNEKFGVTEDYWKATKSDPIDRGRADVTKSDDDLYVFKVPGLRNVAMTPPYFHDGSVETLGDAVRVMAQVQLDTKLSDADLADLLDFLSSLTGKPPADFQTVPVLPTAGFGAPPTAGK